MVIADLDFEGAKQIAAEIDGLAVKTDVGNEAEVIDLSGKTTETFGKIDPVLLKRGDRGYSRFRGGQPASLATHLGSKRDVAHLRRAGRLASDDCARRRLPAQHGLGGRPVDADRFRAIFGDKHAALAFAVWLAITYGDRGIKVSCLCPQGVRTNLLEKATEKGANAFLLEGAIEPENVADAVVEALAEEKFLILPHPEVATYFQHKANDYDRWLRGMRRLQAKASATEA